MDQLSRCKKCSVVGVGQHHAAQIVQTGLIAAGRVGHRQGEGVAVRPGDTVDLVPQRAVLIHGDVRMGHEELQILLQTVVHGAHDGGMGLAHIAEQQQLGADAGLVGLAFPVGAGEAVDGEAEDDAVLPAVFNEILAALVLGEFAQRVGDGRIPVIKAHLERKAGLIFAGAGIVDVLLGLLDQDVAGILAAETLHGVLEKLGLLLVAAVALTDDVAVVACFGAAVDEGQKPLVGGGEELHRVVGDGDLVAAGGAHADQPLVAVVRGDAVPRVDQRQPALQQLGTAHGNGGDVFQPGLALVLHAPDLAVQRLFPRREVLVDGIAGDGIAESAVGARPKLVEPGVELHLVFLVHLVDLVALDDIIPLHGLGAQVENPHACHHAYGKDQGQLRQHLVGIALDLVNLLVGIDTHLHSPRWQFALLGQPSDDLVEMLQFFGAVIGKIWYNIKAI